MARGKAKGVEAGTPVIGLVSVEMHHPQSRSLKDKRMVVKAVKDRLCRRFNVAVAETGYQELWQRSMLSVVSVSSERRGLEAMLEAVARDVEDRHSSEIVDVTIELID